MTHLLAGAKSFAPYRGPLCGLECLRIQSGTQLENPRIGNSAAFFSSQKR